MLTKPERDAILAEIEFIAERMRLAALLAEDCRLHDRDDLVQLFVLIMIVWRTRVFDIVEEVKAEAKLFGLDVRKTMDERGRPSFEVWYKGMCVGRAP